MKEARLNVIGSSRQPSPRRGARLAPRRWAWILVQPLAALAQVGQVPPSLDPGALQQRQLQEQQRREQEERQRIPRVQRPLRADGTAAPALDAAMLAMRMRVAEIGFTPSRFLAADELAALARPLEGREVTLGELLALVERINGLYRERGIATARALLPAQDVTDGRVQVRLVEATLGRVAIDGNASTADAFISERLSQRAADVVDPVALERDLVRFNRLYDAQLRARLEPGRAAATTDLLIDVLEPPRRSWRVGFDNAGALSSGRERLTLGGTWRSLAGRRDELNANLSASSGTWGASLAYALPVNRYDTRVSALLAYDHNRVDSGSFATLGLNGHSVTGSLGLRQPIVVDDRSVIEATVARRDRRSVNRAETVDLQRTALRDWTAGLEGSTVLDPVDVGGALSVSRVDSALTDASGVVTDREYTVVRLSLRGSWAFWPQWALRAGLAAQRNSKAGLPAADQFFLGGDGTVRGYSASVVGGDRGEFLNVELHHPLSAPWLPGRWQASGFAFWDAGRVTPLRAAGSPLPPRDLVRSVGWGLNARIGANLFGRVVLGHRIDAPQSETLGRTAVHVQFNWQLE